MTAAVKWRPYQRQATNAAVLSLKSGKSPLLVLPTGSGKSWNAADAVRRAHAAGLRSVIAAPARELVEQDAAAVAAVTGGALKVSIACAGLGTVDVSGALVIGTPQTLVRRLEQLGHVDLLVVDEAHRLGRKASGQIHTIVTGLRRRNPTLMLLGLTATPFRLDTGRLTEGDDRLVDEIAFEVTYPELVAQKYLAPLVGPRDAIERLDVAGLRIVGGDYVASDLTRFDRDELTERIAEQIIAHGQDRKCWLVFAVSVAHAEHLAAALLTHGIDARLLTGHTPAQARKELVAEFKAGRCRCLVGCDVFSTGFDAPAVDLIAIARPTASPVWHVQSAGRGTRLAPGKRDCLILDFAGNFARLGPIDAPHIRAKGEHVRDSDAPSLTRSCPHCAAIIAASSKRCAVCNRVLVTDSKPRRADTLTTCAAAHSTITGSSVLPVLGVAYGVHRKVGRPDSLCIRYAVAGHRYRSVCEWLTCWHPGLAGAVARDEWRNRLNAGAPQQIPPDALSAAAVAPSRLRWPARVRIAHRENFTSVVPLFDHADRAEVA